jgi:hypothetical protein
MPEIDDPSYTRVMMHRDFPYGYFKTNKKI